MKLRSNLVNIREVDPIYKGFSRALKAYLDEDSRRLYEDNDALRMVCVDAFFLHYTINPILEEYNPDHTLEIARTVFQDYMKTREYIEARRYTMLNEKSSVIYAVALMKEIAEELKRRSRGGSEGREESASTKSGYKVDYKMLMKSLVKASKVVKAAGGLMRVLGAGGASIEVGSLRRIIDLSRSIIDVRGAEKIIDYSMKILSKAPRMHHVGRETGLRGDSIRGYVMTRNVQRAVTRELALPDDLFYAKLFGEGLLSREWERISEYTIYMLMDKCLAGDSEVRVPGGGVVELRDVGVGDRVLSYDPLTRTLKTSIVLEKVERGWSYTLRIDASGESIIASENHLIPTIDPGGGFLVKRASNIRVGDRVLVFRGSRLEPSVVGRVSIEGREYLYDLVLDDPHYYIANNIVVHNSGSMSGLKLVWSRSLALALYKSCVDRRVRFKLRMFDSTTHPDRGFIEDPIEILEYILKTEADGGTRISYAVRSVLSERWGEPKILVLVTDGEDRVDLDRKEIEDSNTTLLTVMVGGDNENLKLISDEYLSIAVDVDGAISVIKATEKIAPRFIREAKFIHA